VLPMGLQRGNGQGIYIRFTSHTPPREASRQCEQLVPLARMTFLVVIKNNSCASHNRNRKMMCSHAVIVKTMQRILCSDK